MQTNRVYKMLPNGLFVPIKKAFAQSDLYVSPLLTNVAMAYSQDNDTFIYDKIFPVVQVQKQSAPYKIFDQGDFLRDEMQPRARSTEAAKVEYAVSQGSYNALVFSLRHDIDDQDRGNADPIMNLERNATRQLTEAVMIKRERTFVTKYMVTGVWGQERQGVNSGAVDGTSVIKWSNVASSPIEDVSAVSESMKLTGGYRPNVGAMSSDVFKILKNHPDLQDRIKYGGTPEAPAKVTLSAMASLFELDELYVEDAIFNAANKGQVKNLQFCTSGKFLLAHRPKAPSIDTPSAGYTFAWTGMSGMNSDGMRTKQYRIDHLSSDAIEIDLAQDQKLTGSDLGAMFNNII